MSGTTWYLLNWDSMQPEAKPSPPGPLAGGIRLGRVLGINVFVHWSLIFIFVLVLANLGAGVFPSWHPDWSPLIAWLTAAGAAVLFLASVLAHELSHSVVARTQGIGVDRITLFLFGGVSEMTEEPATPRAEFLMAVVGPLMSLAIGIVATLGGLWGSSATVSDIVRDLPETFPTVGPLRTLLLWLGPVNILGLFNLVPGFPLDGGRVFRSALWWMTGDVMKATRWAAALGQSFGWLLIFVGFMSLFTGVSAQGLWLLLIGWFLANAAGTSYQQMYLSRTLQNVRVRELLRPVETLEPDVSVQSFVDDYLMRADQSAYPVLVDQQLVGLAHLSDVRKVPREKWPWTRVSDVMTPREALTTVPATMTAAAAAQILARQGTGELPVLIDDTFAGLLEQPDILRWITLHPTESREKER
jgi:Zn-dependent protease/CBS domain-containing protein